MKPISHVIKRNMIFAATLACLIWAGSNSAFAVPPTQVARLLTNPTVTATCCVPIGPTVSVTEPSVIVPVIVTWSVDYEVSAESAFNLSVNGGPCLFFGAGDAPFVNFKGGTGLLSTTYQWLVLPADGVLVKGKNTFTVCEGGIGGPTTMFFSFRTLSVQIGK
ncbi:MAG: hypothetical protein HY010_12350 [Acidobacteria bacterium]|nr:hypothetical protein [Acidobacteriota bacterium]